MSLLREPRGLGAFVKTTPTTTVSLQGTPGSVPASDGEFLQLSTVKIVNNGLKIIETSQAPTPGETTEGVGFLYMKNGSLMFHSPTGTISTLAMP